ncbi:MAG: class I SAM-dependent methyltransferase [Saprospiraceae bacterium]|nr:class I SAM-dependent methyltransferase [Saprospiraceae bacterium]MCF8252848.1 class I SAM-dependent methyltransferase [Saprospiraceae bacterium]MCF8313290.1 class I SAM-dependent methyltransferase [Saprospiraceae bacterium]
MTALSFDNISLFINDIEPGCIAYIEQKFKRTDNLRMTSDVQLVQGTAKSTGLEGMKLDKIIVRNTFHHFEKPDEMCESLRASLKLGGRLYLFDPVPELDSDNDICEKAISGDFIANMVRRHGFDLVMEKEIGEWLLLMFEARL